MARYYFGNRCFEVVNFSPYRVQASGIFSRGTNARTGYQSAKDSFNKSSPSFARSC